MIFSTYNKYIIKLFLGKLILIFSIFFSLILVINILDEINFLQGKNEGFYLPIILTFLNSPSVVFEVFPFIFLIATQFFFISLIENNEIQIFKYSGIKNTKLLITIAITSFFVGIFIIFVFYELSSNLKNNYLKIKNSMIEDKKFLAVVTNNGLFIKDEIGEFKNIINAEKISGNFLINVSITQFNENGKIEKNIIGKKADISDFKWIIEDANVSINNENYFKNKLLFNSNFNLDKINNIFSNLSSLSLYKLFELRNDYKKLNYSLDKIDSHLNKILSLPLFVSLMTILSAILMFRIKYNRNVIFNVVIGVSISVVVYYVNYFINTMGINEIISIKLSIWLPMLFLSLFCLLNTVRINEK